MSGCRCSAQAERARERKGLAQLALHTNRVADTEQAALLRRAAGRKRLDHHHPPAAVSICIAREHAEVVTAHRIGMGRAKKSGRVPHMQCKQPAHPLHPVCEAIQRRTFC